MSELEYKDFLSRINIQEVLRDAGYVLYRRDGLRYPSYVRYDSMGRRVKGDKFIVSGNGNCCFQPPEQKNYNVISFIKEHPQFFAEYRIGMQPDRLVNLVCNRLLDQPLEYRSRRVVAPVTDPVKFDMECYRTEKYDEESPLSQKHFDPYFMQRGISAVTRKAFREYYFLATRSNGIERHFTDLAFPMTVPGKTLTVGLELRSMPATDGSTYKGKAKGSNSSQGLWIASPSGTALKDARRVFWFESAYDAMAYWQIKHDTDKSLSDAVFLSTGGSPTMGQFQGVLREAKNAVHVLCFDNDKAGETYVRRFREEAVKECLEKRQHSRECPDSDYKDWNDQLLERTRYHQDEELVVEVDADGNQTVHEEEEAVEEKRREEDDEDETHKRIRGR